MDHPVLMEEPGFWRIIRLRQFRRTEGVSFDIMPMEVLPRIDGIDRVIHKRHAVPLKMHKNYWARNHSHFCYARNRPKWMAAVLMLKKRSARCSIHPRHAF